jgi:hypothetical protein
MRRASALSADAQQFDVTPVTIIQQVQREDHPRGDGTRSRMHDHNSGYSRSDEGHALRIERSNDWKD